MTMLGGVSRLFYDDIAGIRGPDFFGARPFTPGYKNITIAPQVLGDLTEASATIETVRGTIRSSWCRSGRKLSLNVTIPPNATAEILIPCWGWGEITLAEGGKHIDTDSSKIDVPGIHSVEKSEDLVRCKVGSGSYQFVVSSK